MSNTSGQLLRLENVFKKYKNNIVLDNISFSVNRGETVTLIGPNGAGKSTLMEIALGILDVSSGAVHRAKKISIGLKQENFNI